MCPLNFIKIKLFIGLIVSISLSGCILLFPFYGIKEMTPQDEVAQKAYLMKLNVDTTDLFSLSCLYDDSLSHERFALNTYKLKHGTNASPVQFRLYERNGTLVTGWEQCFGKASRFGYFDNFPMKPKFDNLPINRSLSLSNDLLMFDIDVDKKNELLLLSQKHDYTFILIWAEYAGVFNKRLFRDIYSYIESDSRHNYLVLKMNCAIDCN